MAHPKKGYWIDGKRVPSVTTITGKFKESGGLIHWAHNLGMQGIDYRDVRDNAASSGTMAHSLVENHIRGMPTELDGNTEVERNALAAFDAYLSWERQTKLEITHQEVQLICPEYKFGGALDALGIIDGKRPLLDWKSSNAIYADYLIQIAAYGHLVEHGFICEGGKATDRKLGIKIDGGFHLCRFSKEHGDFSHHYFPNLDDGWQAFKLERELYEVMKQLKKRAS